MNSHSQQRPYWAAVLVLCSLLVLSGTACKKKAPAPTPAPTTPAPTTVVVPASVRVVDLQLGTAVGADRRVTAPTVVFRPADTIYIAVGTEGISPSSTMQARWTYQDGQQVNESTQTIAPNGPEVTEFHIAKPDGWPAGGYKVEILLDGQVVGSRDFTVQAGP